MATWIDDYAGMKNQSKRNVYVVSGGVTKFAKAHPSMDFRLMVKKAFDYAMKDCPKLRLKDIDSSRISYFSDHFARQLKAASMVQDYLGLNPKDSRRIEWGGATGGQYPIRQTRVPKILVRKIASCRIYLRLPHVREKPVEN
ncbi:MAG TPA: hypothetical protein VNE86_05335 [Nitrososphaerales archaeon]|nr:hypothetical protein [Nitrososphaerales archaeon]